MTQRSAAATEVAQALWARAAREATTPGEVAEAAERVCTQLRSGLGRWVGATGYRALLDRALGLARAEHPALGSLSCHGGGQPATTAAVRAHGAAEVTAGMVALVATLIDLLGRIIGEEMAVRLVEQTGIPSPRGVVNIESDKPSPRGAVSTESKGAQWPMSAKKHSRRLAVPKSPGLKLLKTGVPGLDEVLGGGLPALSFNLIAGSPGTGKTTLTMQLLFANATAKRPGLFITLLGETSLKMLRYQQQFDFFDQSRVGSDVHFLNLSEDVLSGDLEGVLARITDEVGRLNPGILIVDSFRSLGGAHGAESPDRQLEHFVQRLALHLTTWEITSFLIGEYEEQELRNPVFTVADGVLWLSQAVHRNSVVRKLQVVKVRGMAPMPGLHTMRMTSAGVQVFPRTPERPQDVPPEGRSPALDRDRRPGRDDGRRHPGGRFPGPGRPDRHRQDDVRDAVRRGRAPRG